MDEWTLHEMVAFHIALIGYFVAGTTTAVHLATGQQRARAVGSIALSTSFVVLTCFFIVGWVRAGSIPLGAPGFDALFLGYVLTGVLLLFDLRHHLPFLRAYLTAIVVGVFFVSIFLIRQATQVTTTEGQRWLLWIHISTSLAAVAVYILASVLGALYLRWHRLLKSRSPLSGGAKAPPLERLDRLGVWAIMAGFVVLTLSLVAGALYGRSASSDGAEVNLLADPKVIAAVFLWAYLAVLCHVRITARVSRKRSAQLTLAGCILLVVVYLAVRGGLHQ